MAAGRQHKPSARLRVLGAGIGAAVVVALGGCASAADPADQALALDADTVIIDVRTPAEFSEGHLEGAVNIDLQSADFDAQIAGLDQDEDYLVYCRSGNRSAQAASVMEAQGLTVQDAGGLTDAASSTGLDITQ